jgi:4-hydroxyacetophenone monooxygenase
VGGTWFVNRYPGCGVDTPNHSYSYSFGPRFRWPRYFSKREDVQAYVTKVVDEFDIRSHIRFGTELKDSHWNKASNCWVSTLECAGKTEVVRTSLLVSAIGQLSDPSIPRIDGAGDYKGVKFHSSMWPDDLQVTGKKVAVVGTGATAMQLVPSIVDAAKSVVIYQRTPQWVRPIPGYAEPIGDGPQWLLEHVPFYAEWFRFNMFWRYGDGLLKFLKKDPEWHYPNRSINRVNDKHRQEMLDFIKSELGDRQDLVDKCVPTYPPYGKRILLDNDWYKTLKKSNVELVVEPIKEINKTGIKTLDGVQRDADVIVYSTGFKVSEMAARLNITGARGIRLADQWKDDNPTAYLGLIVPNFPNFFCMLGPGSGPAHGGSAVFQAECQARYISESVIKMALAKVDAIQVRVEVHDAFMKKFDAEHESLIWSHPGMSTYYRNSNGRVFSVLPWRFVDYWAMTHDPDLAEFDKIYAPSLKSVAS